MMLECDFLLTTEDEKSSIQENIVWREKYSGVHNDRVCFHMIDVWDLFCLRMHISMYVILHDAPVLLWLSYMRYAYLHL